MLVVTGIAESMKDNPPIIKGQNYTFNLFCTNEELHEQLDLIESYLVDKGWNNIEINEQELITDDIVFEHEILKNAFELAKTDGIAGVINNTPIIDQM